MGLVDRLKRTVLNVLRIRPRSNRTSVPTDSPDRIDQAEDPVAASAADAGGTGSETPEDRDGTTHGSDAGAEIRAIDE